MNKTKKNIFVITLLIVLTVIGIIVISIGVSMSKKDEEADNGKLSVVTSFYPMYIATLNITENAEGIQPKGWIPFYSVREVP